jgi:hypothetical protein
MSSGNIFEKLFGGAHVSIEPSYRYYKCNLVNTKWCCIHQSTDMTDTTDGKIVKCPTWIPKILDKYVIQALVNENENENERAK